MLAILPLALCIGLGRDGVAVMTASRPSSIDESASSTNDPDARATIIGRLRAKRA
jgi:hypothetical protein